ncbi:uncharacterized protein LOC122509985 [Leptopilina heterotoma]|uniref:uncharacterized protein LOC122509985 n=1 Tax=Leptopilina heterotoma TaxID=63436 RepID=UPI001CA8F0CB|nr:uncharacterized protein LOC122509985 [Leptopilina heterotoma]
MEVYRPENAFGMNLRTFKIFGVWPSSVKHPVLRFFHILYGYSIHFFYIAILLPAQFISMYIMRNNVQELVDSSFFTLSCIAYASKSIIFITRRKKVEEFFQRLHDPIFTPKRKEHFDVLEESAVTARTTSVALLSIAMTTCITWIIFPLIENREEKTLLFVAWYPYNTTVNPAYGYTYLSQTLLLLTTAAMDTMIDMMTTNFFVLMVGQIEILKLDFRELTDFIVINRSGKTNGFSNDVPLNSSKTYIMRGDMKELVDNSFFTLTCIGYALKLIVFILQRNILEEFFDRLKNPIFFPKRKKHLDVLNKYTISARTNTSIYISLVLATCTSWIIFPLVDSKQEKSFLYAAWFPYDVRTNEAYIYTYISQTFLLLTTASMVSMIDIMTTNFYVSMVCQMEMLKIDFCELTKFSLNSSNTFEDIFYYNEETIDKILNDRIIKCVLRYQATIKYIKDVTNFFETGIAIQVCASSITICTSTYEMTSFSAKTMQFYTYFLYQLCMLYQIFIYTWRGNDITIKATKEKTLLYAAWYPYNVTQNPGYAYTYISQTILLVTTATMNGMIDMLTLNFYVVMVGHMEILKQDFRELTNLFAAHSMSPSIEFSKKNREFYENYQLFNEQKQFVSDLSILQDINTTILNNLYLKSPKDDFLENEESLDKILNDQIIQCLLRYQAIIKFVSDVTNFFQFGIVVQVCVSSFIICATTYEITSISPTTMEFYMYLTYQMCVLYQIFIYTWRGNDITVKTTELMDAVYECGWMSVPSLKFRKSLCIIMSHLQVPMTLCVGKFFLLSVDTFFKIIKMSYSFYVLLKQVNN